MIINTSQLNLLQNEDDGFRYRSQVPIIICKFLISKITYLFHH